MPEYLAPGVFLEEVSFRSKTIEGVATSTTGYAGFARWGPVQFAGGPDSCEPRLITSFTEFERVYGGLEQLEFNPGGPREAYLAHAARAFFDNGGKRLYISRVATGAAAAALLMPSGLRAWRARWPGVHGNVLVIVDVVRRGNSSYDNPDHGGAQASGVRQGAVVELTAAGGTPPADDAALVEADLAVIEEDAGVLDTQGRPLQRFLDSTGAPVATPNGTIIKEVVLQVTVQVGEDRTDVYTDLACHPAQRRFIGRILEQHDPEDQDAMVWADTPDTSPLEETVAVLLDIAASGDRLSGGTDGTVPQPTDLAGTPADPDDATDKATGLEALGEVDDIAIVAVPDGGGYDDAALAEAAAGVVISHAERLRYRIAVVDAPRGSSLNEVREFRGKFDSTRAALYHPWVEIFDPLQRPAQGAPPRRLMLPPSGFVTGIYARTDVTRGVYKAPANEVVRGLTRFEANINTPRNEVLNPEGINALRFFKGRGSRVWGARTMTSDPEWKYVNVRRLFIFLENSIDRAMQYAVFEPNNERLWGNIRQSVEDFLYVQWLDGALLGATPEQAYFVRCDRTTMTQNDLDNGRLICLIGVAPTKPAEFVIFRIGQFTADA